MTGPRDWDKELAEIDKVIEQGGRAEASKGEVTKGEATRGPASTAPVAPAPRAKRRSVALTWFWTSLAIALTVALLVWPYDKSCGIRLVFFLGAAGITALVGLLSSLSAWSNRRGLAHVVSLLVMVWAGVMAAREVLPRIGYARQTATWGCSAQVPVEPVPAPR
jgi:hypothetical protein